MGNPASKHSGHSKMSNVAISMADVRASELRHSITTYLTMIYVKVRLPDGTKRLLKEYLVHRYYDFAGQVFFIRRDSQDNFFVTRSGSKDEIQLPLHKYEKIWESEDGTSISAMVTVEIDRS